jgi:hypothetical protein
LNLIYGAVKQEFLAIIGGYQAACGLFKCFYNLFKDINKALAFAKAKMAGLGIV